MDYSKAVGLNPKYNTFDLSHDKRLSLKMGEIVPVMAVDVLPGDKFTIETSHLTRMLPLVAPVMHNVKVKVRYFFSPNRLVWENWEDFITGPESATDTSEPVHPNIYIPSEPSSLADYLGVSTSVHNNSTSVEVNALPFAHYQFIWNEYFRDQNLQSAKNYQLVNGGNTSNADLVAKRRVAWKHDRFTSALPFTQKGPEVTLPVLQSGTVAGAIDFKSSNLTQDTLYDVSSNNAVATQPIYGSQNGGLTDNTFDLALDNSQNLLIDRSALQASAATINELREAFAIQKWLELNARTGNRYTEHIEAHFGVKAQDARLQRPEEFGGSVGTIQFSEVLQTSQTTTSGSDASALGQLGGHGITAQGSRKASYYAQEHGWIFALMYVVPDTTYSQGVPAKFSKVDRYDYYQPLLAHLGEQPVLNKELFANGNTSQMGGIFGYLPIYDEYRHELNTVHGLMKTDLEYWHLGRKFSSLPALNDSFVKCLPSDRIFVEEDGAEQVIAHVYNDMKVQRKIPYYGTPLGV